MNCGDFGEAVGRPWGILGTPGGPHGRHFDTVGGTFPFFVCDLHPEPRWLYV